MGKLLKENQKATKENIVSILNDFRPVANRTVDEAGKSYFQIEVERYSLDEDIAVYNRLIQKLYAALPEDKKREVLTVSRMMRKIVFTAAQKTTSPRW